MSAIHRKTVASEERLRTNPSVAAIARAALARFEGAGIRAATMVIVGSHGAAALLSVSRIDGRLCARQQSVIGARINLPAEVLACPITGRAEAVMRTTIKELDDD